MIHHRLLFTQRYQFVTSLTPATCERRLSKRVARSFGRSPSQSIVVRGQVSRRGFRLTKRIDLRNWFQTQAIGEFTAIHEGTLITIRFRPSSLALVWYGVCFGWFVFAGTVSVIASLIVPPLAPGGSWRYAAMTLIVLAFLSFAVWSGCWHARDEGPFLIQLLCQTLEAHDSMATPHRTAARPR